MTPTPAVPEEGAVICRLRDVPTDGTWEVRESEYQSWNAIDVAADTFSDFYGGRLVEARPKPEPTVMVELTVSLAEFVARRGPGMGSEAAVELAGAARAALAARQDGAS